MSDVLQLTARDWFEIVGRGWAATFAGIPDFDPRPLCGQPVVIDGEPYMVNGVETFMTYNVAGQPFSLLVGERR